MDICAEWSSVTVLSVRESVTLTSSVATVNDWGAGVLLVEIGANIVLFRMETVLNCVAESCLEESSVLTCRDPSVPPELSEVVVPTTSSVLPIVGVASVEF